MCKLVMDHFLRLIIIGLTEKMKIVSKPVVAKRLKLFIFVGDELNVFSHRAPNNHVHCVHVLFPDFVRRGLPKL